MIRFLTELKRRHVYRVAIAYAVTAWLLLQLGAIVFPTLHAPDWCERVLLGFLVLGFPVAILLAWAFEVTPEGVRHTASADSARRARRGPIAVWDRRSISSSSSFFWPPWACSPGN